MVALLLVYLAGRCLKENVESKDFLLLGIAGAVAIWISHPAALILAGIGLVLLLEKITRKDYAPLAWILGLGIAWTGSFGIEYFVSFRHLVADEFLQNYWRKAFIPIPPWNNKSWFIETYYSLLLISLDRTDLILVWLFLVLMIIGGLSLLVRNRNIALIIILPFFMALLASALQKYPLKYRFMLFLVPFVFLLAAEGLGRVYSLAAKWNRTLALILCGVSVLIIFWIPAPITFGSFLSPFRGSDIKPVMEYVSEHRNPDDIIYVFHGADPAFSYYAPFYDLDNGKIVMGFDTTKKKIALQNFFDDVDKVKGNNRVWFIFSGIIDCGGCEGDMQTFYIESLNNFGTMLDEINASGANSYLYDLSR